MIEQRRNLKSLLHVDKIMYKSRANLEKMLAMMLITYAISLLVGEAIRDVRYAGVDPDAVNLQTNPKLSKSSKWHSFSGLFILIKRRRRLDCAGLSRRSYEFSVISCLEIMSDLLSQLEPNPLTAELMLTAAELRSKERQQALRSLAARSPSTSLSNLAYLLDGYSEAGGGKYAEVLQQISQRIQQILAVRLRSRQVARNRAVAKALLSARIIPVVLLIVFLFLTRDPLIQESILYLPVQVVISTGIGMMVLGYLLIRSIVSEAV